MGKKLVVFITASLILLCSLLPVHAFDPLDMPPKEIEKITDQKLRKVIKRLTVIHRKKKQKKKKKKPVKKEMDHTPPVPKKPPEPKKKYVLVEPQYREEDLEVLGYFNDTVIVKNRRTNMIFLIKNGGKYNNCKISKEGVKCYEKVRIF